MSHKCFHCVGHHAQQHHHTRPVDVSEANIRLIGLVRSGLLNLSNFQVTDFDLDGVNEAVAHAAAHAGPFKLSVIRP